MVLYDFKVKNIKNELISLDKYKGKVLLIVNTAPKCGFAPQYEGLEKLYEIYREQGFEILDFPSNQFMNQAPGTNEEIKEFCELTYGTQFETFSKIDVNGNKEEPLYNYLKQHAPYEIRDNGKAEGFFRKIIFGNNIKWNFTKFLVNREGKVVKRFSPGFKPEKLEAHIKEVL